MKHFTTVILITFLIVIVVLGQVWAEETDISADKILEGFTANAEAVNDLTCTIKIDCRELEGIPDIDKAGIEAYFKYKKPCLFYMDVRINAFLGLKDVGRMKSYIKDGYLWAFMRYGDVKEGFRIKLGKENIFELLTKGLLDMFGMGLSLLHCQLSPELILVDKDIDLFQEDICGSPHIIICSKASPEEDSSPTSLIRENISRSFIIDSKDNLIRKMLVSLDLSDHPIGGAVSFSTESYVQKTKMRNGFSFPETICITGCTSQIIQGETNRIKGSVLLKIKDVKINRGLDDSEFYIKDFYGLLVRDSQIEVPVVYQKALEKDPYNPHLYYNLGLSLKDSDERFAIEALRHAWELSPESRELYPELARYYSSINDGGMIKLFSKTAEKNNAGSSSFYRELADFHEKAGNTKTAERYFKMAMEAEPSVSNIYSLALCYERLGKAKKAISIYYKILDNPKEIAPLMAGRVLRRILELSDNEKGLLKLKDTLTSGHIVIPEQMKQAIISDIAKKIKDAGAGY